MAEVSVAQAKAGFAALVARAEKGERIIVTRNGRAVACLGPLPPERPFAYGDLQGKVWLGEDLSLPDDILDDFDKSIEKLAKSIDVPELDK